METVETNTDQPNQSLLSWHTPEFLPHPRSTRWFITAGLFVIAFVAYAIFTGSATMAIVFIMLAGMYYLTHNQTPKVYDVHITELGVFVDQKFYAYNNIAAFWIVYSPPYVSALYLRVGNKNPKTLRIELNEQNPVEVRNLLSKEIPEIEDQDENMIDVIIRLLRLQ